MSPPDGNDPPAVRGYRELLGPSVAVTSYPRFDFYDAARSPSVAVIVASGDIRQYANLLLTIGVKTSAADRDEHC